MTTHGFTLAQIWVPLGMALAFAAPLLHIIPARKDGRALLADFRHSPVSLQLVLGLFILGAISLSWAWLTWHAQSEQASFDLCLVGYSSILSGFLIILLHCNPNNSGVMRAWVNQLHGLAFAFWLLALLGTVVNMCFGLVALILVKAGADIQVLFNAMVMDLVLGLLIVPFAYLGTAVSTGTGAGLSVPSSPTLKE